MIAGTVTAGSSPRRDGVVASSHEQHDAIRRAPGMSSLPGTRGVPDVGQISPAVPHLPWRLFPRLRRAVESSTALRRRAGEAVVLEFSAFLVTEEELSQAQAALLLETIAVDDGRNVLLHLTDSSGQHVMDGYGPAARFDMDGRMADVAIKA